MSQLVPKGFSQLFFFYFFLNSFLLILKLEALRQNAIIALVVRSSISKLNCLSKKKHTHTHASGSKTKGKRKKKNNRGIKTSGKQRNDFTATTDTTYKHTFPFGVVSFLFMHATPTERDLIPLEEIPLPNSFATVLPAGK
jgi:hypothetical protein